MKAGIYSQEVRKVSKLQVTVGIPRLADAHAEARYHGHEVKESLYLQVRQPQVCICLWRTSWFPG